MLYGYDTVVVTENARQQRNIKHDVVSLDPELLKGCCYVTGERSVRHHLDELMVEEMPRERLPRERLRQPREKRESQLKTRVRRVPV